MKRRATRDGSLGEILAEMMPGSSGRTRKLLLEHRRVTVAGAIAKRTDHPVRAGDEVAIGPATARPDRLLPATLEVRHEDEDVIVARKSAGLLSIATPREREKTAYAFLSAHVKRSDPRAKVFVVHRLDQLASGLLAFAKSEDAKRALQAQFEAHTVERAYAAVVEGTMPAASGTLESRIDEPAAGGRVRETRSATRGRRAVTHWRVVETNGAFSLLEVRLETGRKNQIRVQLEGAGKPIVGDDAYGSRIDPLGRLALHASTLGFGHPATGERLRFEDPVPPEFLRLARSAPRARPG